MAYYALRGIPQYMVLHVPYPNALGENPSTLDCYITVHSSVLQAKEPAALVRIFSPLNYILSGS